MLIRALLLLCFSCSVLHGAQMKKIELQSKEKNSMAEKKDEHVAKKVLDNGLTVLVRTIRTIPKVCVQMWYNVGSKDEKDREKGIAHLIEHMIFKGTEKMSESDINLVVHKLSGRCNAFTAYDFTGYLFDMPTHHWKKVLPIIADCMTNASFKDEHLNSEMKAVVQEMKMIKDQHLRSLAYKLLTLMFAGHPYHYPTIGHKQDLWSVKGEDLKKFYKKHYVPNNAALVVVGDVDPEDVFVLAQKYFGSIKPSKNYKKENFHLNKDIVSRSLTMYRDIALPEVMLAFRVPGMKEKGEHTFDVLTLSLVNGKSSRLYKKLVDELQLVTSIGGFSWRMFDHGVFFLYFTPKDTKDIEKVEAVIFEEIKNVAKNGLKKEEIESALKRAQMAYYSKMENGERQAYDIGRYFLATGDPKYSFSYLEVDSKQIQKDIKCLMGDFFRETVVHKGKIFPLPQGEQEYWKKLQESSDELDNKILSARIRTTSVEKPRYAHKVVVEDSQGFDFPKPSKLQLSNGVKVLYCHNGNTPKINLILSLKAKDYYDLDDKQGVYNFVMRMLSEGTENYTAAEIAEFIESNGMSFHASPGLISISILRSDFQKGLEILEEILSRSVFDKDQMEKVREQIYAKIKEFWDSPLSFSNQLINEYIYEGHPYSKNVLGTKESIASIDQDDLKSFYKNYISPDGAKLAIIGDLEGLDLQKILERKFARWKGPKVEDIAFPKLKQTKGKKIDHYINRDQVVLCFAGLSIDRRHKDYDKLRLFDQIFGGGELGSMSSRLIQLREQSGLFYTIGGALAAGAGEQPGMAIVKTLVSLDRLSEAETVIKNTIDKSFEQISDQEFIQARRAIVNSLVNNFESNEKIALAFLFLDKYGFPADYFDNRAQSLAQLSIDEVRNAVKKILKSKNMITVRIGRVGDKQSFATT